jgi:oligoendopeptidase F
MDTILILKEIRAMAADVQSLTKSFESYRDLVEKLMEDHKAEVQAAVDKALADDEIADSAAMETLQKEIEDAQAKFNPPPFEQSNQ